MKEEEIFEEIVRLKAVLNRYEENFYFDLRTLM